VIKVNEKLWKVEVIITRKLPHYSHIQHKLYVDCVGVQSWRFKISVWLKKPTHQTYIS